MKIVRDMNFYKGIQSESKNEISLFADNINTIKNKRVLSIAQLLLLGNEFNDKFIIPYYQRSLVWTKEQKESFIKSIFNRNDLGTIIFKRAKVDEHLEWTIIDGLQRYTAIKDFIECKFKVCGSTFDDLTYTDKFCFVATDVVIAEYPYLDKNGELNLYAAKNLSETFHTLE